MSAGNLLIPNRSAHGTVWPLCLFTRFTMTTNTTRRLRARLRTDGLALRKSSARTLSTLGEFYLLNLDLNCVSCVDVDPEQLAASYGLTP